MAAHGPLRGKGRGGARAMRDKDKDSPGDSRRVRETPGEYGRLQESTGDSRRIRERGGLYIQDFLTTLRN